MTEKLLTIGQLAQQADLRTSALRYYEKEGLLTPDGRSEAGYRLYKPQALQRLHLIQRAQRLGFSLADIRTLLNGWDTGNLSDEAIITTAEERFVALERQLTELLVVRHELDLFLQDLHTREADEAATNFDALLQRVCANPAAQAPATAVLDWLRHYTGCVLNTAVGQTLLDSLRGQHSHIWQEDGAYHILVVSHDPQIGQVLEQLAQLEANCDVHTHPQPHLSSSEEGYLLVARGDNAFIFARLFLALEQETVA